MEDQNAPSQDEQASEQDSARIAEEKREQEQRDPRRMKGERATRATSDPRIARPH